MLRTIIWYTLGWTYLVITSPALLWVKCLEKSGKIKKRDAFADNFSMFLARGLFFLTGSSVTVTGLENIPQNKPVLFVSNHQSHMDSAIIHGFIRLPKGFIAMKEAKSIPILSTWMKYMKCIFINREDVRQSVRGMKKGVEFLKEGHSMVIYPEGRLSQSSQPGEFKNGCVKLAAGARVPIVPITLNHSWRIMNREASRICPTKVTCIISKPLYITSLKGKDERVITQKVRDIISENLTAQG